MPFKHTRTRHAVSSVSFSKYSKKVVYSWGKKYKASLFNIFNYIIIIIFWNMLKERTYFSKKQCLYLCSTNRSNFITGNMWIIIVFHKLKLYFPMDNYKTIWKMIVVVALYWFLISKLLFWSFAVKLLSDTLMLLPFVLSLCIYETLRH